MRVVISILVLGAIVFLVDPKPDCKEGFLALWTPVTSWFCVYGYDPSEAPDSLRSNGEGGR